MVESVEQTGVEDQLHDFGGVLKHKSIIELSLRLHYGSKLPVVSLRCQNRVGTDLVGSKDSWELCNKLDERGLHPESSIEGVPDSIAIQTSA